MRGARTGRTSAVVTERVVTRTEAAIPIPGRILSDDGNSRTRIAKTAILATNKSRRSVQLWLAASTAVLVIVSAKSAAADDTMATKAPAIPYSDAAPYNWNGFYAGGHLGVAWGNSNWTASSPGAPSVSGSTDLFQPIDTFDEAGSFFAGLQAGYNYMLPNRVLIGAEVDATFPAWPNLAGISIGGTSAFTSPTLGAESYSETVLASGSVRGRIGYAPGHWLFYATGGFAWTYDRLTLTQLVGGASESPFLWRLGFAAGAGVEVPIAPHWTARFEYLFTDYGTGSTTFFGGAQRIASDFSVQELRAGLNYQFGNAAAPSIMATKAPAQADADNVSFHGQTTFVWQGYPAFRSPYEGPFSLPGGGEGRETFDATLFAGLRLWRGAELWVNPEIDQGFGFADTHGTAGFPSGEAYKFGADYPYARVQRYFVRQTIDLGGETEKIDADVNQFAGSQTANRLVLTVGKFAIVDIFDTNKYANNPKTDFLNWSLLNAGTFDYAGDAWGYTYGAAAEWYVSRFTLRGGVFDLSASPAGAADNAQSYGLDPTFHQFQLVGEIEERHELWGQPGKLKITGFLSRGNAGSFQDAITLSQQPGPLFGDPTDALAAVRVYQSRPGVSLNLEQQVTETIGLFARAGWADGNVEPWDFTDIDRTVSGGVSITGKQWGRPDDTIGIAGAINGIASVHQAYFNAGGVGVLIGDGQLPNYGLEQIVEAYYSYSISASMKVSVDYQLIANPAYNIDRGPVNVFSGRLHATF
jgi:high affinity Mn2+ porin